MPVILGVTTMFVPFLYPIYLTIAPCIIQFTHLQHLSSNFHPEIKLYCLHFSASSVCIIWRTFPLSFSKLKNQDFSWANITIIDQTFGLFYCVSMCLCNQAKRVMFANLRPGILAVLSICFKFILLVRQYFSSHCTSKINFIFGD